MTPPTRVPASNLPAAGAPLAGRRRRVLAVAVIFALAGAGFAAWRAAGPGAGSSSAGDSGVPALMALQLPDAQGRMVDIAGYRGRTLVVNFWATWCAPCIEEMPQLSELNVELAASNARIVGIGIDTAANIGDFARKNQISYPLLVAGGSGLELLNRLGDSAGALPFTLVIDARGRVIQRITGRFDRVKLRDLILKSVAADT